LSSSFLENNEKINAGISIFIEGGFLTAYPHLWIIRLNAY